MTPRLGATTGDPADDHAMAWASLAPMWQDLAPIGRDPDTGGYVRFAWTDTDRQLRAWFARAAAERGMGVHEDRAGNLWAWWGDTPEGDVVVTGSHLDSVPQGGAFDGPLGVVTGFAAIDLLRARGASPDRPIAVAAFSDEEGARFGVACAGSRLLTGQLDPERARRLTDDAGVTMEQALRDSGRRPARLGRDDDVLRRIGVFVELHIEQGRRLVQLERPIGIATAIRAHGRWRYDLQGRADHAGTTRLEDRNDPMLRQAGLVVAARAAAATHGAVATVGKIQIEPGAVNAIPSRVRAWLDVRADDEPTVRSIVAEVSTAAGTTPIEESWTPAVEFDPDLRRRLSRRLGGVPELATGAGHDAGILASSGIPTAMLFVRNPTGVSHAPDEHAEEPDRIAGVLALADVLEELACR